MKISIKAMSDRNRLKKERMLTEYKTTRNKVKKKNCQKRKEIVNLWKTTKISLARSEHFHQTEPTLDRRKFRIISQMMQLMTTFCPLQNLSQITNPAQNALLISVSKRQRALIRLPYL